MLEQHILELALNNASLDAGDASRNTEEMVELGEQFFRLNQISARLGNRYDPLVLQAIRQTPAISETDINDKNLLNQWLQHPFLTKKPPKSTGREEFGEPFAPSKEYGELLGHSMYFMSKDVGKPVEFIPPAFALKDITTVGGQKRTVPPFGNASHKKKKDKKTLPPIPRILLCAVSLQTQ